MKIYAVLCSILFQAITNIHGNCDLPSEVKSAYWRAYTDTDEVITENFSSTKIDFLYQGSIYEGHSYECEGTVSASPFTYFLTHKAGADTEKYCFQILPEANVIVQRMISVESSIVQAGRCKDLLVADTTTSFEVLVEYENSAFVLSEPKCPRDINPGSYDVEYTELEGDTQCQGSRASEATIVHEDDGGNKEAVMLDTCYTGVSSYYQPWDSDIECIEGFSHQALGSQSANGDFLLLSIIDGNTRRFYCARYKIFFDTNTIKFSLDATDKKTCSCARLKSYDTVEPVDASAPSRAGYKAVTLEANDCLKSPCENGGTCNQQIGDYTCTCLAGYTGKDCQTDIDDCAINPCQNGGSCTDAVNDYTCNCLGGYTGKNCETEVCTLGSELTKKWLISHDDKDTIEFQEYIIKTKTDNTDAEFLCERDLKISDQWFMGSNNIADTDKRKCIGAAASGKILLYRQTPQETQTSIWSGSQCKAKLDSIQDLIIGFEISNPLTADATAIDMSGGTCPFTLGEYQMVYSENGAAQECVDDDGSTGAVQSDAINTASCFSGTANYDHPLKGSSLMCVQTVDASFLGDSGDDVIVLAYEKQLYCARYRKEDIKIYLSLYIDDPMTPKCQVGKSATTSEPGYTAIVLTSNKCASSPCQNGGTCTDLLQDFRCSCIAGFTGDRCETNINECSSNPCVQGSCEDEVNMFTCNCHTGYSGTLCDDYDDCVSNPCLNGATCHDRQDAYSCECAQGYTGTRCDTDVNECDSSPCLNGGTCTNHVGRFSCQCPEGTTGERCEIDADECISEPCLNGGTCLNRVNGYYCRCTVHYLGVHCEHPDECGSFPCLNGGECLDDLLFYTCKCPRGFTGHNCETLSDSGTPPCDFKPCQNGGSCVVASDSSAPYLCVCDKGYTGSNCEEPQAHTADNEDNSLTQLDIILIVVLGALALAVVAIIIFVKKCKAMS